MNNKLIIFRNSQDGLLYYSMGQDYKKITFDQGNVVKIKECFSTIENKTDYIIERINTVDGFCTTLLFKGVQMVAGGGGGRGPRGAQGTQGTQGAQGATGGVITNATLVGDGTQQNPLSLPYKVYIANLSQSGANPPTATVFTDTIGIVGYTYISVGNYGIVTVNGFPNASRVQIFFGTNANTTIDFDYYGAVIDVNTVQVISTAFNDHQTGFQDGTLGDTPIEIRVYP